MPFWSKSKSRQVRLFFATDVHGSEPTFRKFINAAKFYGIDVLVLGGDVTGKLMVPVIALGNKKTTRLNSTVIINEKSLF